MDQNTKDILETVNFIKDRMLTRNEGATRQPVASGAGSVRDGGEG